MVEHLKEGSRSHGLRADLTLLCDSGARLIEVLEDGFDLQLKSGQTLDDGLGFADPEAARELRSRLAAGRPLFGHALSIKGDQRLFFACTASDPVLLVAARSLADLAEHSEQLLAWSSRAFGQQNLRKRALARLGERNFIPEVLAECLELVRCELEPELVRIWLLDSSEQRLELCASAGAESAAVGEERVHQIAAQSRAVLSGDFAGCPLVIEESVIGVLAIFSRVPPKRRALDALEAIGEACALALGRLRGLAEMTNRVKQLRRMMDGSQDGYWDWHVPTGVILYTSAFSEMLGYGPNGIAPDAKEIIKLVHEEDQAPCRSIVDAHWRGETPSFELEVRLRTSGGDWKWVLSRGKVHSWRAAGQPEWMSGTHTDITLRKLMERELSASEAKFRDIFEGMEEGYVEASREGQVLTINRAAVRLLGRESSAASLWDWFAPEDSARVQEALDRAGSVSLKRATLGGLRELECSLRLRPDRIVLIFRDLSDWRRAEREAEASRFKSELLANMSHEMRTPMHAVLGLTHLALQTELSERQRDYLLKIQESGQTLLHLVNDVLDFAKVEAGKVELEEVDLALDDLLDEVIASTAPYALERNLELVVEVAPDVPTHFIGDPMRLRQVLLNLVNNAVKFTERGEVRVVVSVSGEPSDGVVLLRFEVSDTGCGIPAEVVSGLFDAFTQADSSITRRFGGTGLGLAICSRLVRLMQGSISVQSTPGKGSKFELTARLRIPAEPPPVQRFDPVRAAVLGDGPASLPLAQALSRLGSDVVPWPRGSEAPPELIFLVGVSARSLVASLRHGKARLVAVVRQGDTASIEQAVTDGANGILLSPFTLSRIHKTVTDMLRDPAHSPARLPSAERIGRNAFRGTRVLVVEDNRINQQIARELLEKAGMVVELAYNGQEAVERVSDGGFDLVLMDLQMPVMDGYTATALIRRNPRFRKLPILAVTAHMLSDERERCLRAGMDAYISKPIDPDTMFAIIRRHLPKERPVPAGEIPEMDGVDTRRGLMRVAGNATLYRKLLLELAAGEEQARAEMLGTRDPEQLRALAHTLKGAAGNLGLRELQSRCEQLESAARHTPQECFALVDGLLEQQARVFATLRRALAPTLPDTPTKASDEALSRLIEQLRAFDGAALVTLDEARAFLASRVPAEQLQRVETLIRQYAFEEALRYLTALTR